MHTIREAVVNYRGPKKQIPERISEAADAIRFLQKALTNNAQEHFIALYLDGSNKPIGYKIVGIGSANCCTVHPREVFQCAVHLGAVSLIMAHNHPSGNLETSAADDLVTSEIGKAGKLLGIKVLDHIVFNSDNQHYSYNDRGRLA